MANRKKAKVTLVLEYAGKQFQAEEVKKHLLQKVEAMMPDTVIKELGVYLQPETDIVFYTVNGEGSPEWHLPFDELL